MTTNVTLRKPRPTDGHAVNRLIALCPPLDTNSTYCNLLQCSHFADTSVCAELNGALVGFVSGYRLPAQPDTLFIWQVAVGEAARGQGLARTMVDHLIQRPAEASLRWLHTTITNDNDASWALFRRIAAAHDTDITHSVGFEEKLHFDGRHATEMLVQVGPFQN